VKGRLSQRDLLVPLLPKGSLRRVEIDKKVSTPDPLVMRLSGRTFCAGMFFTAGLAMVALALPNAGRGPLWRQYGFNARHTLFNPFEHTLHQSNVAGL